jgi:UDP-glucuronate decarboxylase
MRHDVTFPLYVEVDEIYNLACPASPIHYQHDPVQTTKTSVHGAINMLGLAKRLKAKHLPGLHQRGVRGSRNCIRSRNYWGHVNPIGTRAAAMTRASAAPRPCSSTTSASTDFEIKVARIFNTYGPRMHPNDGRVVSNFIVQALSNEPITLYGEGTQSRSFCYVDDLIEGFARLMDSPRMTSRVPVNLGNPGEFTMIELADTIRDLTGSRSEFIHLALPADDPRQRQPEITLAREQLGWEPKIPLLEGLKPTITYFEHILSIGSRRREPTA